MVMKRNAMRKNLTQSILRSLGRYLAIVAIIALGSAMFVGLLMTKTDMVATGQAHMDRQNMFDLRLIGSYGWSEESVAQVSGLPGVEKAEGLFYLDAVARLEGAEESVYRFYSMPEEVNRISLRGGRMPQAPNECLIDGFLADDSFLGKEVHISRVNEEDTLDTLRWDTYTIVGYVATPLYMDTNRGTTSVGNGSVETYFFLPEEGLDANYYTEINLTIPGSFDVYTDAYNDAMEQAAENLEPLMEPVLQDRFGEIRQEAEEAYAEGYAEYEDGLRELEEGKLQAQQELSDAYRQLKDAEAEIAENEHLLADGQKQIDSGWQVIRENEKMIQSSRAELETAKADAYRQLEEAKAELDSNSAEVAEGLTQVNEGLAQIEEGLAQVNDGIAQLEEGLAQIEEGITQLELLMPMLRAAEEVLQAALDAANAQIVPDTEEIARLRAELEAAQAELAAYSAQLEELYGMRETLHVQLEELYATRAELELTRQELLRNKLTLEAAQAAIDEGYAQLEAGRAEADDRFEQAEAEIAEGERQLQVAKNTLYAKQKELDEGKAVLEEGKAELSDGWREYEEGKAEAEAEIADAEAKLVEAKQELSDARAEIDALEQPELMILDRNSNVGYNSLNSSSDIVQGVSRVFPAFFLLVAALVCITTMTRMIDEERTQIGTLKALGYSNGAIISKYLIYAGSSAILGCGLGVLVGSCLFPTILWQAYKIMLYITDDMVLKVNWWLCAAVVLAYTSVVLLVTWYCCRRALAEVPAELIRPKAPEAGKKILLEYLPFWDKIGFLNKVAIRNILRYRQRLAMMLVGIGGCTALLVTGFGLRDSIVNVVDYQFRDVTVYDMTVQFSQGQTLEQQVQFLNQTEDITENVMFYHQSSIELSFDSQTREIYLIAAGEGLEQFLDLHVDNLQLGLPSQNEVLLSVGVADMMGIEPGDRVVIRNGDMEELELTVSGIYDNHINNYAVISPAAMERKWGSLPEQQMAFVKVADGTDPHEVAAEIMGMDHVLNVSVSEDLAEMVGGLMDALDLVVWVVVFCAALLAVIVLYNLTNINMNERIREIATIKVLGFQAGETAMYVFKENLALTAVGSVLGLGLGYLLLVFVMSQVRIDFVWFKTMVMPLSYVLALVITLLSALVVDFVFYFRLDKINMAEALKSVE